MSSSTNSYLACLRTSLQLLLTEASLSQGMRGAAAVQGTCMKIVSIAMAARTHTHGVPCELLDSLMSLANMLLKESGHTGCVDEGASDEVRNSRVEGGWHLICVCMRAGAEWVEGYIPLVIKLCSDFLPAATAHYSLAEWQRAMLGAANALAALRLVLQGRNSKNSAFL